MKKTVLVVALAIGVTGAFAQDLTSKKGEKFLPEANDWSIGFDATPALNAVGRVMGGSQGTSMSNPFGSTQYIVGKMFKDEKTAYRAALGINFGSTTTKNNVYDDQVGVATPDPTKTVEDSWKSSTNSITIGAGIEKRRGTTRLQGYYGGMLMINFGNSGSNTYTYGNAMSTTNAAPTSTTNWSSKTAAASASRTTESKGGSTFGLGLNGFIGAEYFVAPKIAVGAEYWWGIGFSSTGEGSMTSETISAGAVKSTSTKMAGGSSFNIGNSVSAVMVNFYF
ncbi:MAG: hypothetical protein IT235_08175 [Bacteroidia bacterium]|nr:hypothetical protein [Bacteroidia bacterium]